MDRPPNPYLTQARERIAFTNPARSDGLILRHWRKKADPDLATAAASEDKEDVKTEGSVQAPPESDYYYAKFNVKIKVPEYREQEYEAHLKDKDWSKAETDYLVQVCEEYDLRWILIADRYNYRASISVNDGAGATASPVVPAQPRSLEELKARYYAVAATMMAIRQPLSSMSSSEFDTHEKMTKFDADLETRRKSMVEALLSRTPEEVKEEEVLLSELKRIVGQQERLMEERRELYNRLDAPHSTGNTQIYQSSQGLNQLLHTLLAADKGKKRKSLAGPGEGASSPAPGGSGPNTGSSVTHRESGHRESISGTGTGGGGGTSTNKKGTPVTERRKLTAREEEIYGVTHHDRLTSGVQFRHDKVNRLAQAKSNLQAQRVANALTELEIPTRLVMPTAKVCAEFERLIQSIHTLIDVRKVSEKVEGEIKVFLAQKEERERKERAERGEVEPEVQADPEKGPEPEKQATDADPASPSSVIPAQSKNVETNLGEDVAKDDKPEPNGDPVTNKDTQTPAVPSTTTTPTQPIPDPAPAVAAAAEPAPAAAEEAPPQSTTTHKRSVSEMSASSERSPSKRLKR